MPGLCNPCWCRMTVWKGLYMTLKHLIPTPALCFSFVTDYLVNNFCIRTFTRVLWIDVMIQEPQKFHWWAEWFSRHGLTIKLLLVTWLYFSLFSLQNSLFFPCLWTCPCLPHFKAFQASTGEGGAGRGPHSGPRRNQDYIWQHPRHLRSSHQNKGAQCEALSVFIFSALTNLQCLVLNSCLC